MQDAKFGVRMRSGFLVRSFVAYGVLTFSGLALCTTVGKNPGVEGLAVFSDEPCQGLSGRYFKTHFHSYSSMWPEGSCWRPLPGARIESVYPPVSAGQPDRVFIQSSKEFAHFHWNLAHPLGKRLREESLP